MIRVFDRKKIEVFKREENYIEFRYDGYSYIGTVISESINGKIRIDIKSQNIDNNNIV